MKGRLYLTDEATVRGLIKARKELLTAARGMTAQDMRDAISEIYVAARIFETPQTAEDMQKLYAVDGEGIAHIPIVGILTPSIDPCAAFFGDAETEYGFIRAAVKAANEDFRVQGLQLEIDSPGGYVDEIGETSRVIRESIKPVTSMVHNMAASAAYWLASQAGRIVASSRADVVGSIGVAVDEYDDDEYLAQQGVVHRVYTSTDAPDKRPNTKVPEGRAKIVKMLDDMHGVFASEVAAGRGTTAEDVNENYGRGGLVIAAEAVAAGMIDEIVGETRPGVAGDTAAKADGTKKTGRGTMTLEELKRDHPDLYAAVLAAGREAGVVEERKRVEKLRAWADADPACAQVVAEAIAGGQTYDDVAPKIHAAIRKAAKEEKPEGVENPPEVKTATTTTASGEQGADEEEAARVQAKALVASLPKD